MNSRSRISPVALRRPGLLGTGDRSKKRFAGRSGVLAPLIDRMERAFLLAAYVVVRHGSVYAPLVDRLERELEAARQNEPIERAQRILEAYAAHRRQLRAGATPSGRAREQPRN